MDAISRSIINNLRVSTSQTFNTFLLTAQKETRREQMENINLDVFLMNEHRVTVTVLTTEQTDVVLENVCSQLNVPEDLINCFSLFLIRRDDDGNVTVLRKLQDFESPYISRKALCISNSSVNENHQAELTAGSKSSNEMFYLNNYEMQILNGTCED